MPWITLTPSHNSAGKFFFSLLPRHNRIFRNQHGGLLLHVSLEPTNNDRNRRHLSDLRSWNIKLVPKAVYKWPLGLSTVPIVHLSRVYEVLEPRDPTHPINDGATDFKWKSLVASLNKGTCWCFAACQDLNSSKISPNSSGSGSWSLHHHYGWNLRAFEHVFINILPIPPFFFRKNTQVFWGSSDDKVFAYSSSPKGKRRIWKRDFSFKVRHGG